MVRKRLLSLGLALAMAHFAAPTMSQTTDDPACGEACSIYCHCGPGPSPCSGV
jgi:hypothetical protein